jgi:hypothetical protein
MTSLMERYSKRNPATLAALRWLDPNPNLPDGGLRIASLYGMLASDLMERVEDSPELTKALRTLCESKNLAVQASLADSEGFRLPSDSGVAGQRVR